MNALSDSSLQQAYEKALELNLDHHFIVMIEQELLKRTKEPYIENSAQSFQ